MNYLNWQCKNTCYRTYKKLGLRCGYYGINVISEPNWGGTREKGKTRPFVYRANQKNTRLLHERHRDMMNGDTSKNENRILS